ncbi:helix-turn-helix domain-containing protein [Arenibacter sp. ARW7G5Y1]|uniref:helix-turn-helix domain-containing protein n=1 Tax=Arenibacter sp. ARW7G5Y1 TaxID=2135619 RepID=UPI000D766F1B|nr:helix-turn-helix domain-containing protein [Arenibacter sp. ARW7G5Y1]PXX23741.1 AraC-like DNA-binding protein [Arenibacter sp. ARW7G5Y1]
MVPLRTEHRMQEIQQMLLEMAGGNFFYRLETSERNDNVEALAIVLNMLAEEIQESFYHQGYVSSKGTTEHLVQMCFLLDGDGIVQMANQKACTILSKLYGNIVRKPFSDLLTDASKTDWVQKWRTLCKKSFYDMAIPLNFLTNDNLVIPNRCHITSIKSEEDGSHNVLITVIHTTTGRTFGKERNRTAINPDSNGKNSQKKVTRPKVKLSYEDIRKIREGQEMILNNLQMDLPNLKDLAHQLGTNEFKLKYGFKELYGTTVFKYLVQERLRKAKTLVQYTQLNFKSIAKMVGFKSVPHFSRAFSEQYGYSPKIFRKKADLGEI